MCGKITCDVIRDLMILCEDDVCSEDSRRLIEEHISECEECRKIYEMTNAQIPEMIFKETSKENEVEHQAVKAFKKIKKKMTFEAIMKCGIVVLIVLMINYAWNFFVEERLNVIPSSEVEVTEVYQLKNGDYYATLECDGRFVWDHCDVLYLPEDGNRFTSEEFCYEINFQRPYFWEWNRELYKDKISIHFPKENYAFGKNYPIKECVSIQYVTGSGKEELIIWEEGQRVKAASEEIEQRVDEQIDLYSPGFTIHHAGVILENNL